MTPSRDWNLRAVPTYRLTQRCFKLLTSDHNVERLILDPKPVGVSTCHADHRCQTGGFKLRQVADCECVLFIEQTCTDSSLHLGRSCHCKSPVSRGGVSQYERCQQQSAGQECY